MLVAWIALGLSIATTIFWVGVYVGSLRGQLSRMRTRVRDLERGYASLADRKFKPRVIERNEE